MLEDVDGLELIRTAIEMDASDIHLTVGQRPYMRCLGKLQAMRSTALTESFIAGFIARLFNDGQQEKLAADRELDASWTFAGRRFRVHAYYQQGFPAMALRLLPERIPALTELELPAVWQKMKELDKGLIFVTAHRLRQEYHLGFVYSGAQPGKGLPYCDLGSAHRIHL